MRDKMLGRWMVRLAVTLSAGSIALGVSAAAAYAGDISRSSRYLSVPGAASVVGVADLLSIEPERSYATEDYSWN